MAQIASSSVRLATMDELIKNILPNFLAPIPHPDTLRAWFDRAKVRRLKSNPTARRGGGTVYYVVSDVEKLLRSFAAPIAA